MTNEELVLECQNGYKAAMDELIEKNKGLVKYFALKYKGYVNNTLDIEDLEQEAWMGFMNAVKRYKFNEDEPVQFSTYASKAIIGRILRAVDNDSQRMKKSDKSTKVSITSFSAVLSGTDDVTVEYSIPDEKAEEPFRDIEKKVDNEILRNDIFEMLDAVFHNDIGKRIIIQYYGLYGKPMTFEEIGEQYRLSTEWIRRLEIDALRQIRHSKAGKAFMVKYYDEYIEILENRKESINQYHSPDMVVSQMAGVDELLNSILKKYEA